MPQNLICFLYLFLTINLGSCNVTTQTTPSVSDFIKKFTLEAKGLNIAFKLPKEEINPLPKFEIDHFIINQADHEIFPFAIHTLSEEFYTISYYRKSAEGLEFFMQTLSLEGKPLGSSLIVKYTKEALIRSTYKCCHNIETRYSLQGKTSDFLLKELKITKGGNWKTVRDLSALVFNYKPVSNNWRGNYSYKNGSLKNKKDFIGNDYELSLEGPPKLMIPSYNMSSPHAEMMLVVEEKKGRISIYLNELIYSTKVGNKSFSNLEKGDLLFELEKKDENIITKWGKLKPLYNEVKNEGIFFKPL